MLARNVDVCVVDARDPKNEGHFARAVLYYIILLLNSKKKGVLLAEGIELCSNNKEQSTS